ncbi:MAG: hypothetical protein R3E08_09460 [Thiotrichaceae bacterium]
MPKFFDYQPSINFIFGIKSAKAMYVMNFTEVEKIEELRGNGVTVNR